MVEFAWETVIRQYKIFFVMLSGDRYFLNISYLIALGKSDAG
ncbi:hypothetical protein [Myxosarcina sp. GI1(2024)]